MKYIAFISHSNKDGKALHAVQRHLESCGYTCFASERDLLHNAGWQAQLVEAMDSSEMLIYLHSKNANDSAEVGREINYFADKCHRPILVYRLDDVPYNRDRSYYLQSINYIDSLVSPSDSLEQLVDNIKRTLEGKDAETLANNHGKARIALHHLAVPLLAAVILICGFLAFHAVEKNKAARLQQQSAALLSGVEGWLAREDSLDMVLPAIDEARAMYGEIGRLLTVKAPEEPDFQGIRESSIQEMSEIRDRRISTVKALYEPLQYVSRENSASSIEVISSNIQKIFLLDSLLNVPTDKEIETILNNIR